MKVHGIELREMKRWEVQALVSALYILGRAESRIWQKVKVNTRPTPEQQKSLSALGRVRRYLHDINPHNTKSSRTFARDKVYPVRKDADGNRLCRWCQKPVPRPRMSYCNDDCLREVDCRTNAGQLRRYVFERDKGVCSECGCDTEKIRRVADHAGQSFKNCESYGKPLRDSYRGAGRLGWWTADVWVVFMRMGFNYSGHLWEADHIVPHSEGGESSLENIQTLCIPCHKEKTKRMHRERKVARREANRELMGQLSLV